MRFASRLESMGSTVVKETLKLTTTPGLISFAGGMPSADVFPVAEIKRAVCAVLDECPTTALQYGATNGWAPLREKIAARQRSQGIDCTADDVYMISGSQQALDLAGKVFLDPDDVVLCEDPTYLAVLPALGAYQATFVPVATDDCGMVPDDLERKIEANNPRVKLIYVIPTFQNPTGRTWSVERRRALLDIASRHDLPIIEDDPYGELRLEGTRVPSLKSMDSDGRVIYLGSFSKILSPGIRLGWMCASPDLLEKLGGAKQSADLQASTFTQLMVDRYLADNDLDASIARMCDVYRGRRDLMMAAMEREFPKGTTWTHPQGGLFIWVTLPEGADTAKTIERAVERGVAFIPGVVFFANADRKNCLRLNFSNATDEQIETGIKLIGEVLREG